MKFKIVTNGKRYRLMRPDGKFWEQFSVGPEGDGHFYTWQTRFYLRALKKLAKLKQNDIRYDTKETWSAV